MDLPIIVIVDDDPLVTQMLEIVFDLYVDATVIALQSPVQALQAFSTHSISLLITDFLMPEMSGLELLRSIRNKGIEIPVIILTGYFDVMEFSSIEDALAPYEIHVKPWNNQDLIGRVNTLLNAHGG